MPKVSVIVPVYGVEKYIERCARSLFEQTLDDIEYLFIDDCTPDRSIEILQQVLEDYPQRKSQVVIHRMEQNSGQAAVRKWGMQNASGEYVIHCDSDDWVDKDYCGLLYEEVRRKGCDIVVCNFFVTDGDKKCSVKSEMFSDSISKEELLKAVLHGTVSSSLCNKLIKRSLLVDNPILFPNGNMGEDMVILIQAIHYAKMVNYIPETLYYYYYNEKSITKDTSLERVIERFRSSVVNTKIFESFFREKGLIKTLDDEFTYLKLRKISYLLPVVSDKQIFLEWKNTFPELFSKIGRSKIIPLKEKINFYVTYFGFRGGKFK